MRKLLMCGLLMVAAGTLLYFGQKYSLPRMGLQALKPGAFFVTSLFTIAATACSTAAKVAIQD